MSPRISPRRTMWSTNLQTLLNWMLLLRVLFDLARELVTADIGRDTKASILLPYVPNAFTWK